jgi:hypothetical protein
MVVRTRAALAVVARLRQPQQRRQLSVLVVVAAPQEQVEQLPAVQVELLAAVVVVGAVHQSTALILALAVLAAMATAAYTLGKDNRDAFCNT